MKIGKANGQNICTRIDMKCMKEEEPIWLY